MTTYPADWPAISIATRDSAGGRCVRCNHPSDRPGQLVPCDEFCRHKPNGKQRMLTVHHLDGDKANCAWWNLAALCQVCHLFIQSVYLPGQTVAMLLMVEAWLAPYEAGRLANAERSLSVD